MLRVDKATQMKPSTLITGRRNLASGHGHGHEHGHGHGDHGHGHHEPFEVPHYTKYNNWEACPDLVNHQRRLNAIGLSDPWVRNYAWAYYPDMLQHSGTKKLFKSLFGGFKYGVVAAGVAILFTEGLIYYNKKNAPDHHEHH